jgi:hypothetical protein
MWHEALTGFGDVTPIVVPVAGPPAPNSDEIVVRPSGGPHQDVPMLAQGISRDLGHLALEQHRHRLASAGEIGLVVVVRSYLGPLAVGLSEASGAHLVVDLDDDDAAYLRSRGDQDEAARVDRLVDNLRSRADLVVSAQGFAGTRPVPNSVPIPDVLRHRGSVPTTGRSAPRVVMVGNMGYGPNVEGARWFVASVLPLVRAQLPDIEVQLVGPGSERFGQFGVGYIEDLDAVLGGADVVVAPIRHGSGTRIKILDAWAHGRPVVSTSVGADGLGAVDGDHLLIADDASSFAAAVVRVARDASLGAALGSAGRRLAARCYSRERVVADVRDLLRRTLVPERSGSSSHRWKSGSTGVPLDRTATNEPRSMP